MKREPKHYVINKAGICKYFLISATLLYDRCVISRDFLVAPSFLFSSCAASSSRRAMSAFAIWCLGSCTCVHYSLGVRPWQSRQLVIAVFQHGVICALYGPIAVVSLLRDRVDACMCGRKRSEMKRTA